MNKIKRLKEKYDMSSEEDLNHAFRMHLPRMVETIKEREQHFLGLNTKHHDLQSKLANSEESLNSEKQILNGKIQDLLSYGVRLNEVEVDKNNLLLEVHQLETQRNQLRNKKPNMKDLHTVEHGKKKFEYYKLLTGIRWDFGAPKGTTKGYISNGKDHIHTFNYQDRECSSKLKELLWKEVARGTGRSEINNSDCKENWIPNK